MNRRGGVTEWTAPQKSLTDSSPQQKINGHEYLNPSFNQAHETGNEKDEFHLVTEAWKAELLFVPLTVDRSEILGLLDSGAEVSVIGQELSRRLGLPRRNGPKLSLHGCGGTTGTSGWVQLDAMLPTGRHVSLLVIENAEFGTALILGTPFLKYLDGEIHYNARVLQTPSGPVSLLSLPTLGAANAASAVFTIAAAISLSPEDQKALETALNHAECSTEQRKQIEDLLVEFSDLWVGKRRGQTSVVHHKVQVSYPGPIRTRPRHFAPPQQKIIDDEVKAMEADGVIQPSTSPHATDVVLVKKRQMNGGCVLISENLTVLQFQTNTLFRVFEIWSDKYKTRDGL